MKLQYLNQVDAPIKHIMDQYKMGGLSKVDYDPIMDVYIAQSDFGEDGKPTSICTFKFTGLYNSEGMPQIEYEKTPIDLSQINNVDSIRRDPSGDGFLVATEQVQLGVYHYHNDGSTTRWGNCF